MAEIRYPTHIPILEEDELSHRTPLTTNEGAFADESSLVKYFFFGGGLLLIYKFEVVDVHCAALTAGKIVAAF